MTKLTTLKPRIAVQPLRLTVTQDRAGATPRIRGRKWMDRRARWLQEHPLCCDCEAEGRTTVADEVDHVIPLWEGGADDETNYASRCIPHHQAKTAREAARRAGSA